MQQLNSRFKLSASSKMLPQIVGIALSALSLSAVLWIASVGYAEDLSEQEPSDRYFGFVPVAADSSAEFDPNDETRRSLNAITPLVSGAPVAERAWTNYRKLWQEHHANPADETIRRYLGLRLANNEGLASAASPNRNNANQYSINAKRGRAAPSYLKWKPRSYAQIDTPHFTIHSMAGREASLQAAKDLEDTYWLWTQWFFPFWVDAPKVRLHLGKLESSKSISDQLAKSNARLATKKRMRVVLFRDAEQYVATLREDNPGIQQSTGFYHDGQRTIFLYASGAKATGSSDLAADQAQNANVEQIRETLQHELVHQLFREASLSKLGRTIPGEQRDFWIVEGIAGYFESMVIRDGVASVGGWDAPRLQYARHRVLASGDSMPLSELRRDGRLAAQNRDDIARWYAHAILRSHVMMDQKDSTNVRWLFDRIADVYQIDLSVSGFDEIKESDAEPPDDPETIRKFLRIDDQAVQLNTPLRDIQKLCLAHCSVTSAGVKNLPPLKSPVWVDLAYCNVNNDAVKHLVPNPDSLEQLSLERTAIGDGLASWLERANRLKEVDVSWTQSGDAVATTLGRSKKIQVLWMTGTQVSDEAIDAIASLPNLQRLDVQRSKVSDQAITELQKRHPDLQVNPLVLRSEEP